jgi:hypothetical protein
MKGPVIAGLFRVLSKFITYGTAFADSDVKQWPNHCLILENEENSMKRIKGILMMAAFAVTLMCLPAIASAQYGNGGYYPNGGYGNGGKGDIRSVIRDLKDRSKDLQRGIDTDLDHSRMNGSRREDDINRIAKDFRDAAGRLSENDYGRQDGRLQRVFELGSELQGAMGRVRMSYNTQNAWGAVRSDLQVLSRGNGGYNNRYPDNGNRNNYPNTNRNGGWNNNGGRGSLPSWWPF